MNKSSKLALLIIGVVLIADQALKIWVKTYMFIGESSYTHWGWAIKQFQIAFTENPGMAFGWKLPGSTGKILLSVFRLIAIGFLGWYVFRASKKGEHIGFVSSLALILAGAVGNMIDSTFYGMIFSDSGYQANAVAQIFPPEGGYAPILQGKVVDMLYFPIIDTYLPDWFPFSAGKHFVFFSPIFNIADAAVTCGVFTILIFQKRFFRGRKQEETKIN